MITDRVRRALLSHCAGEQEDLAAAALDLARLEYPELEPAPYLEEMDRFAQHVRDVAPAALSSSSPVAAIGALREKLFTEERFIGAKEDYYDPQNSYLNRVIDRRRGIPITLSVLYIAVGRRLGLPLLPVGYPGHFLVRCEAGECSVLVDPYEEGIITDARSRQHRLDAVFGGALRELPEYLEPVSTRQVLKRMLSNLKVIYTASSDYPRTQRTIEALLILSPDSMQETRDLAAAALAAGDLVEARASFERYLALAPPEEEAESVRQVVDLLRKRIAQRN